MVAVLDDVNNRQPEVARRLLQQHIVPRRELVIRVSEDVQALNRGPSCSSRRASLKSIG